MVKKILKAAYVLSLSAACLASPWSEDDQANLARLFSIAEENAAAIIAANREVSEERKRKTISGRLAEASSFGGGAVYGTAERLDDVLQTGTSERLNYSLGYRIDLFKLASPKIRLPEMEAMRLQLMQDLKADIVTVYAEILTLRRGQGLKERKLKELERLGVSKKALLEKGEITELEIIELETVIGEAKHELFKLQVAEESALYRLAALCGAEKKELEGWI